MMHVSKPHCLLAGFSLLLSGCCVLFPDYPDCHNAGVSFTLKVGNGVTPCADEGGEFDLEFKFEYFDADGKTQVDSDESAALGTIETITVSDAGDANHDGLIDYVEVSINISCSPRNPLWQTYDFFAQVPVDGGLDFQVDEYDQVTYQIVSGTASPAQQTISAVNQVTGAKVGSSKSATKASARKKSCCQ